MAPSSSDLLGSILSREPHLWGGGDMNILSVQIQPRHMLARPHPSHLACSCCHSGCTLGTRLSPSTHILSLSVSLSSPHVAGPQVGGCLRFCDAGRLRRQRKRMAEKRQGLRGWWIGCNLEFSRIPTVALPSHVSLGKRL
jgi:hypothetical protein